MIRYMISQVQQRF